MDTRIVHLTCEVELKPGEHLHLPKEVTERIGPGRWRVTIQSAGEPTRDHSAFLKSYAPEDEGLYDDCQPG